MTHDAASDLSGEWHGIYTYPDGLGQVDFDAAISDTGGALTGTIREVDAIYHRGAVLEATLEGSRRGTRIHFTKYYESGEEGFDTVFYAGELVDDGQEVHGRWDIPGAWAGSFVMVRPSARAAEAVRAVEVTVR